MAQFLTTSEIAQMYGLADSTIRHYRSSGRLAPSRKTPGGHARYALLDVVAVLGEPGGGPAAPVSPSQDAKIIGMQRERFAPAGQHDLRSSAPWGVPSHEVVAVGRRELQDAVIQRSAATPRWGGRLLKARTAVAA